MTRLTIGQRINAVRKTCPYIQKKKQVETYKAVTHDQVTAELRASLIEYGVLIVPQLQSGATVDTGRKTKSGNPIFRFEGVYAVGFVSDDDLADAINVIVPAHADDQGDKAPGKATSYAVKSAMLKLFSIETGEDEESRIQDDAPPLTAEELLAVKNRIAKIDNVEELRSFVRRCAEAAAERGDGSAKDQIIADGTKRAAELAKPEVEAPKPKTEPAQNPDAEGADTDAAAKRGPPASAAMIKILRAAIKAHNGDEAEVCSRYHVEKITDLDKVEAAAAIKSFA